jgi:hypothetical protein
MVTRGWLKVTCPLFQTRRRPPRAQLAVVAILFRSPRPVGSHFHPAGCSPKALRAAERSAGHVPGPDSSRPTSRPFILTVRTRGPPGAQCFPVSTRWVAAAGIFLFGPPQAGDPAILPAARELPQIRCSPATRRKSASASPDCGTSPNPASAHKRPTMASAGSNSIDPSGQAGSRRSR